MKYICIRVKTSPFHIFALINPLFIIEVFSKMAHQLLTVIMTCFTSLHLTVVIVVAIVFISLVATVADVITAFYLQPINLLTHAFLLLAP